jgi:hypothetical protein
LVEKEKGTPKVGCAEEGKMKSGTKLSGNPENLRRKELGARFANEECDVSLPERVRATVAVKPGEYDARRLRSQREVIRDVMLAATDCDTWLTLGELRALTRYGEASISAQLRHLRKLENGGYDVSKQRREDAVAAGASADGRGDCVWEYRILHILRLGQDAASLTAPGISQV